MTNQNAGKIWVLENIGIRFRGVDLGSLVFWFFFVISEKARNYRKRPSKTADLEFLIVANLTTIDVDAVFCYVDIFSVQDSAHGLTFLNNFYTILPSNKNVQSI